MLQDWSNTTSNAPKNGKWFFILIGPSIWELMVKTQKVLSFSERIFSELTDGPFQLTDDPFDLTDAFFCLKKDL